MDYYEGVVVNYLRADRSVFANTEYCIQHKSGKLINNRDKDGPVWYCDAVALDFGSKVIFLCEISYATNLGDLTRRLRDWHNNWEKLCAALKRDSRLSEFSWPVRPCLFVPKDCVQTPEKALKEIEKEPPKFDAKITPLEDVPPWRFHYDVVPGQPRVEMPLKKVEKDTSRIC
jgi:hypothetical protein